MRDYIRNVAQNNLMTALVNGKRLNDLEFQLKIDRALVAMHEDAKSNPHMLYHAKGYLIQHARAEIEAHAEKTTDIIENLINQRFVSLNAFKAGY